MDRFHNLSGDQQVQLYTPVDGVRGADLILDPNYATQEKHDGERMVIRVDVAGNVTSTNRKGNLSERGLLTVTMIADCRRINDVIGGGGFTVDGEAVGGTFYAFDLLQYQSTDLRTWRFDDRDRELSKLCKLVKLQAIVKSKTEFKRSGKIFMLGELKARDAEGIMFKRIDAPYSIGRARDQFKHKFWETVTIVVTGLNERRSVRMAVIGKRGKLIPVGNLTVPPNRAMPCQGALIEVKYLNASPETNSLYQATYRRRRTDVDQADSITQLKYKAKEAA